MTSFWLIHSEASMSSNHPGVTLKKHLESDIIAFTVTSTSMGLATQQPKSGEHKNKKRIICAARHSREAHGQPKLPFGLSQYTRGNGQGGGGGRRMGGGGISHVEHRSTSLRGNSCGLQREEEQRKAHWMSPFWMRSMKSCCRWCGASPGRSSKGYRKKSMAYSTTPLDHTSIGLP